MASKIARGVSVEEATDEIVESTYFAAIRAGKEKEWNWAKEVHAVMRMGFDFINKHPEYRNRLPEDLEGPFSEKFIAGHEPKIVCAPHIGWHVRGKWGSAAGITPANGVSRISPPDASSVGQPAVGAAGSKTLSSTLGRYETPPHSPGDNGYMANITCAERQASLPDRAAWGKAPCSLSKHVPWQRALPWSLICSNVNGAWFFFLW